MSDSNTVKLKSYIDNANVIVVVQADNPDADSLGSALALEQILSEMGKQVHLYCGVDMPSYLHYFNGHSRVSSELPNKFDASIIVDTSTISLLGKLQESGQASRLGTHPCIVLDHHGQTENDIPYCSLAIVRPDVSSTGELIYTIGKDCGWPFDDTSARAIMGAILGDTQGLTNNMATVDTYKVMADLISHGADRPALEEARRAESRMHPSIYKYKATLIERSDFAADGRIAHVSIPQNEISQYSPLYNPAPLVQPDMLMTEGVSVALVFKYYTDGKILCSIRCNPGSGIAAELAAAFGGGGHAYAAGFKLQDGRPLNEVKSECLRECTGLLDKLQ